MSDKSMSYGREGDRLFVNSATGWSRDRVYETLDVADWDGSVPWRYVYRITGGADLFGNVAMRRYTQSYGYSRRTAHALLASLNPPAVCGIPYTWKSSIHALVTSHCTKVYAAQLKRAGWTAMTDCCSGTVLRKP